MAVAKIGASILILSLAFIAYKINVLLTLPPLPKIEDEWWGHGIKPSKEDTSIRNFTINIPDKDLADLKFRLDHARPFTPPLEGIQQQYGMNTNLLKEITDYWRTQYNWRQREKLFNKFPQFKTNIQGLDIHFIHVKPDVPNSVRILPLLMVHGWPGSVREFYEIIPLLTQQREGRDFVFEVILPHIPGYGFSMPAAKPGLGVAQVAVIFKNLMHRLGFERYYLQGGDFGAVILESLAILFPEKVLGMHLNMCTASTPMAYIKTITGALFSTLLGKGDPEHSLMKSIELGLRESGYLHIQATKPDTIGVALQESPVGLAAYMLEKFTTASNVSFQVQEDGGLKNIFSYNDLIDNIMVYWLTGSMPTAIRLYAETFSKKAFQLGISMHPITTPHACARFRNDYYASENILREKYLNLVHLSDHEGGHFAAFQLPQVLAGDIFAAVRKFIDSTNQIKHETTTYNL